MENEPKAMLEIIDTEQSQEEILSVLENAIESQSEVELTVINLDGNRDRTAIVIPWSIEQDVLGLTTQSGWGMAIDLSRIKRAVKIE